MTVAGTSSHCIDFVGGFTGKRTSDQLGTEGFPLPPLACLPVNARFHWTTPASWLGGTHTPATPHTTATHTASLNLRVKSVSTNSSATHLVTHALAYDTVLQHIWRLTCCKHHTAIAACIITYMCTGFGLISASHTAVHGHVPMQTCDSADTHVSALNSDITHACIPHNNNNKPEYAMLGG